MGQANREKSFFTGSYLLWRLLAIPESCTQTPIKSIIASNPSSSLGFNGAPRTAPGLIDEDALDPTPAVWLIAPICFAKLPIQKKR